MYNCCTLYAQNYVYNFLTHSVHLWSQYDLYFVGQHDVPLLCVIKWWRLVVLFDQELSSSWDRRPWPQETWAKKRGLLCPFREEVGPRLIQCGLGRGLLQYRTNWRLHPSSHLATIDMGQKIVWAWGWVCPFSGGSCRVPIEQSCLGQDLPPYPVAS